MSSAAAPSRPTYPYPPSGSHQPFSFVQLLNVLISHRWKVVGPPLVLMVLAIGVSLSSETTYTSTASFMPDRESVNQRGGLAAAASKFGLDLGTQQTGQSLQFYAHLLETQEILRSAVSTEYSLSLDSEDEEQKTLVEIFQVKGSDSAARLTTAAGRLEKQTEVSIAGSTGIIELSVTTRYPELSRQIAERLVTLLEKFNQETRQSRAAAEAKFIRNQLTNARQELLRAEDSLEHFLERNRSFRNSPNLTFEHERLQRRVRRKERLYSSLAESYEQARISQVRNTPKITVVEPPRAPQKPDPRPVSVKAAFGLVLGGLAGIFWAFGAEFIGDARRSDPEAYERFVDLKREMLRDLRNAGRRLLPPWRGNTE